MGGLAQKPDGLKFLPIAHQSLQLQGQLRVQRGPGQECGKVGAPWIVRTVAGIVSGTAEGLRSGKLYGLVVLNLLLPVLARHGRGFHTRPGGHGSLDLGCIVGLGAPCQIQLVPVSVGHPSVARLQCRGESPEGCGEDKGRNQNRQNVAHT